MKLLKLIHDYIFGWNLIGKIPTNKKAVIFSYPHTSYFDGFYILILSYIFNGYLLFKNEGWIGYIGDLFGHITVERNSKLNQTDQISDFIKNKEKIWLFMSPEGTTHRNDYIRTGFYHIAKKSQIPIICANYNYQKGTYQFSNSIDSRQPLEEVMKEIRSFYKDNNLYNSGRNPNKEAPLKIKKII